MAAKNDLVGRRFGRLVAQELMDTSGSSGGRHWNCICDCGEVKAVARGKLTDGSVQSCGCLHRESVADRSRTHGMSNTPEWAAWHSLRDRCTNPNNAAYDGYGGRGISVHPEWLQSFEAFYRDVGPRPTPQHSIDRRNNDGNYEPGNVRWATGSAQQLNRRVNKNNSLGVRGVSPTQDGKFLANMRVGGKVVLNKAYRTIEEATVARQEAEEVHKPK